MFKKILPNSSNLMCYSVFDMRHLLILLHSLASLKISLLILQSYSSLMLAAEENTDIQDVMSAVLGVLRRISQGGLVIVYYK